MKVTFISDTHGFHDQLYLLPGDLLVHSGDVSGRGSRGEIIDFLQWFRAQPFRHKVFIAGNHDFYFEDTPAEEIDQLIPQDITYLNDSGVTIDGLNIWGSPVQPWFLNWAFNRQRGPEIDQHWQLIPENTDLLITHGPPKGVLDRTFRRESVGCEALLNRIREVAPRYAVFGHIHEAYGMKTEGPTTFINASSVNLQYQVVNDPVVLELNKQEIQ